MKWFPEKILDGKESASDIIYLAILDQRLQFCHKSIQYFHPCTYVWAHEPESKSFVVGTVSRIDNVLYTYVRVCEEHYTPLFCKPIAWNGAFVLFPLIKCPVFMNGILRKEPSVRSEAAPCRNYQESAAARSCRCMTSLFLYVGAIYTPVNLAI